jgi:hypothetical protein
MKRRQFVFALAALAASDVPALAASAPAGKLGQSWNVPKGASVEVWPAQAGLDLAGALDAIAEWRIVPGARVVLRLDDGVHAQTKAIELNHPDGQRLSIIGNLRQPERCRLTWDGRSEGFYAGAGAVLGMLDGLLLEQTVPAARGQGSGVLAELGGVIRCGPHVLVRNFYYGFQARIGGVITCAGTTSTGAGDANYFAYNGGHLFAQDTHALGARDQANGLGSGFVAEYGGTIDATGAVAKFNLLAGFTALSNGAIRAHRTTAQQNGKAGFYAATGGTIEAHDAIARANCGQGTLLREPTASIGGDRMVIQSNSAEPSSCLQRPDVTRNAP